MGLDCSHDAFYGAYSAFNRLRQFVCAATGGSFPPHWIHYANGEFMRDSAGDTLKRTDVADRMWIFGEGFERDEYPGLFEFLAHSDCDGEISSEMCVKVADDLERLMPRMNELRWNSYGHIAHQGGFVPVIRKFIAGCRAAAVAGEPLRFR